MKCRQLLWRRGLASMLVALAWSPVFSESQSEFTEHWLVRPAMNSKSMAFIPDEPLENYERRRGEIETQADLAEICAKLQVGDRLRLRFFSSALDSTEETPDYVVTVVAVSQSPLSVWTVRGRLKGEEFESVVLTVAEDGYAIHCHDISTGIVFAAAGSSSHRWGRVVEADLSKMPPRHCCGGQP